MSDRLEVIARALCRYEFGTKAEDLPTKAGPLMWETFRGAAHDVLKHLEAHGYRIERPELLRANQKAGD